MKKPKGRCRYQYNIPFHTFFVNGKTKTFKAPFSRDLLNESAEGRVLLRHGYKKGTVSTSRRIFTLQAELAERCEQAKAVIAFLRAHWFSLSCCSRWHECEEGVLEDLFSEIENGY